MSGATRPLVVVNPRAAGGRTESTWRALAPRVDAALGGAEVEMTRCVGDGRRLGIEAARGGRALVVAVGGDGTVSEVADGLLAGRNGGAHDAPALGLLPCGTASDLVRGLGIPSDPRTALERLRARRTRRIDVGRVHYVAHDGAQAVRHFVNGASLGFSADVAARVNASTRRRWGRMAYVVTSLPMLLRGSRSDVRLRADGRDLAESPLLVAAVGNGPSVGGGMTFFRDASIDDGLLRVVVVRARSPLRRLLLVPALYRHPRRPPRGVEYLDVGRLECEAAAGAAAVGIEVDGETPGRLPAVFEILPRALSVVC